MAVERIEEYRQLDGTDILKVYLKPTKNFPSDNYFYADAEDIDLIQNYAWLKGDKCMPYIVADTDVEKLLFHRELAFKKLGYYPDYIDHYNHVEFDNCNSNLFAVSNSENGQNKASAGYCFYIANRYPSGRWCISLCRSLGDLKFYPDNELDACHLRYQKEHIYYTNPYNFFEDRANDLDILDMERTGQITHEESIYRHVLRYADNAWYYHRYNLEEYFKDNHIPVPKYTLDDLGFLVDSVTGEKLNPFYKGKY